MHISSRHKRSSCSSALYMAGSFQLVHRCDAPSMLQGICATHACRWHAKTCCADTLKCDHSAFDELRETTQVMA